MSQLVWLEGKHTYQNAHCALVILLNTMSGILQVIFVAVRPHCGWQGKLDEGGHGGW